MSDNMLYRYGATNPVEAACDLATGVEIGDLCLQDTNDAKPASDEAWDTDLATTQENFHDHFLGVSSQRSRAAVDDDDIRIGTEGVYEFDCAAATFELGDYVGPAKQTGDLLENQKVVAVAGPNLAIGRVAKRYGSNTTKVLVRVFSVVMTGGCQAPA